MTTAFFWEALSNAGGALALTFIVAIAAGLNALTLLFLGSAVVALERFSRAVRRWSTVLVIGALWSLLVAAGAMTWGSPDGTASAAAQIGFGRALAGSAVSVALCVALLWLVLRRVSSARLGTATVLLLGVGYALVVGGSGRLAYAAAPALVAALAAGALALRRRRRPGDDGASETERQLRLLAGVFTLGVALAVALPTPNVAVASGGGVLVGLVLVALLFGLVPLAAAGLLDTRGSAEWFIAVRYLLAKRRQTFISVITGICVVGIAAGVWLIITVLSVMNGFERTWREEIIGNRAHFTVHSGLGPIERYAEIVEKVEANPDVIAASPFLDAEGMVRGNQGEIMAVRLRGVDPARAGSVTDLRDDLVVGSIEALAEEGEGDPPILIGSRLAAPLGVGVGDPLLLVSPFGGPQTPLGPAPRLTRFRVAGIFESSFFQYDEMYTYVNIAAAQDFRRVGDVADGIEARTNDYYRSRQVADVVAAGLGFPYYARDWKEFFPAFFQALKSERVMMFILLTMIMVVAAFSIVSTLVMMIMEKESDIAILKAMGAEDDAVERIFAIEGTLIGLVGTFLGVVAAVAVTTRIAWIQQQIETVVGIDTLPASVYQFSTLPAELDLGQIVTSVALALVLSLGATLLPSRQAARLDPVESLRYE